MTEYTLPAATRIGRVALRVQSIDEVLPFYRDVVGLPVAREADRAVLGAGDGQVVLEATPDAPARPADAAGLFHLALRVPDRAALGDALARLEGSGAMTGASDHLVSEALYARDPAGNGVEVYRDRPRDEWPGPDEQLMDTRPLDTAGVRSAATGAETLPAGTDVGHVHLEVTALERATDFYAGRLGMTVTEDGYGGATFVAAGDYHHHVGLNVWNGRTAPVGDHLGLAWFELLVPEQGLTDLADRLEVTATTIDDPVVTVTDPDGMELRLRPA